MKSYLLFCQLLAGILLSGCTTSYFSYPNEERLTKMPSFPHDNPVEIFFPGESMPVSPYIRIALLKAKSLDGSNQTGLITSLKRKAQETGCDALLIIDQEHFEEVRTNIGIEDTYSVSGQSMLSIGIKYLDSLAYQPGLLREKEVFSFRAGDPEPVPTGSIRFQPDGRLQEMDLKGRARLAYYYSLDYLVEQEEGWEFHYGTPVPDGPPPLIRRRISNQTVPDRVKVFYQDPDRPRQLIITAMNGVAGQYIKMDITYDEEGRLFERRWRTPTRGDLLARITYDEKGLPEMEYLYYLENGQEKPFAKVQYHYYAEEEWESILKEEQVIDPKATKP